ncbi:hypothetical protein V8E55_010845 [Tylopilus felleus]
MVLSTSHRARNSTVPKAYTQQLLDTPLDVLIEIFLLLEPLDLLHLARTTKALREFLLDRRKSSALWNSVIGNVEGFPPCPDHLSPPAYTHLAFVPVCHGCFCSCETIYWDLRMRCCPDCFPEMTIPRYSAFIKVGRSDQNKLDLPLATKRCTLNRDYGLAITVTVEHVVNSFSSSDWRLARYCKRPRSISSEEFQAQRNGLWQSIRTHARSCRQWEYRILKEEAARLTLMREQRVEDIKGKLRDLGWTDAVSSADHEYGFLLLPEVRKPEPLTPTEWADIRPQLTCWAQNVKKDMVRKTCMATFTTTSRSVRQELERDTSLKSMLESALNSDISQDNLEKKLLRVLPRAIRKWSSDAVQELEQARSRSCRQRLKFDEALSHDHLYREKREEEGKDRREKTDEISAYDTFIMGFSLRPRNIQGLQIDVTASRRVENLVRRMGQNPSRVTYDELRRSTVEVVCGLCNPKDSMRMNFEDAFQHCLGTHFGKKETEVWSRASARK